MDIGFSFSLTCKSGNIAVIAGDHAEFAINFWDLDRFGVSTRNGSSQKTVQRRRGQSLARMTFHFQAVSYRSKSCSKMTSRLVIVYWVFCASSPSRRKTKHSWTKQAFHQTLETRPLDWSFRERYVNDEMTLIPASALGRLLLSSEIDDQGIASCPGCRCGTRSARTTVPSKDQYIHRKVEDHYLDSDLIRSSTI